MTPFKSFVLLLCSATFAPSESYIFSRAGAHPNLLQLAKAQTGTLLNIGLEVQNPETQSGLYVDGLTLQLHDPESIPPVHDIKQCISLPGANGEYPEMSTGPLPMTTKSRGSFVSRDGKQTMKIEKEAWEMVWLEDRPAGSVICGFHLPEPLIRNDAVLPSGKIFLNFRVWTSKGLQMARNDKMMHERNISKYSVEQKDALDKMNSTNNPILKAVHFRNAAAANEKLSLIKTNRHDTVPDREDDLIEVGDGLLIGKQGSMWTSVLRPSLLGSKETNCYLGSAVLKELTRDYEQ
jgi:hypothetical protein